MIRSLAALVLLFAFAIPGGLNAAPKPAPAPKKDSAKEKEKEPPRKIVDDVIQKTDGTELKGKVSRIELGGISMTDTGGKLVTLKPEEVSRIILGDMPESLITANGLMAERDYSRAIDLYKAALEEVAKGRARDLHKPDILLNLARACRGANYDAQALETLKRLRSECGPCLVRRESYRLAIDIARARRDEALPQILSEMKNEPDPLRGEAELELAKESYRRGDYNAAQKAFSAIVGKSDSAAAEIARAWVMRCLRAVKKTDELEALCKSVSAASVSSLALRQALQASQGTLLLAKAGGDKAKLRDALHAFLKAVAVGPPAKDDVPDDYAGSLLGAAQCYNLLARSAGTPEARAEYKTWAAGYLQELIRSYRGTEWGKLAEKEQGADGPSKKDGASKEKGK
jgi:tetratricopeptide (TPR) repeat protein